MSRLTEEMVIARSRQSDLGSIKKLNCWGSELSDVTIIRRMRGVEVLALSVNKISSLADFEECSKLQELYLRKNNIKDINDLVYLQGLPHLKKLWLEENPCCEAAGPNYRYIVLRALPNLEMLDNVAVTQEELAEAHKMSDSEPREEVYEEEYQNGPSQQQQQYQQQQQQQQQQFRNQSPIRERSPGSDSSPHGGSGGGYRDRPHIAPSMSTHSMKEYYQSERPAPAQYRHSQNDLTEWDESNHNSTAHDQSNQRRSGPSEYSSRNGSREDWEDNERSRRHGRPSDTASVVSNAVLNHYASYHRRPINRSSNLLSATLCLVKELDYPSLEVVEHAVRCRLDELAVE